MPSAKPPGVDCGSPLLVELIDGTAIKTPRKPRKISELQISNRR
jgi:hypothetical protein